jgi:hypothetical protein
VHFGRVEPFVQAGKYVRGLMSDLPRKNSWTLAEYAGDATPDRMQRRLERASWDRELIVASAHAADRELLFAVDHHTPYAVPVDPDATAGGLVPTPVQHLTLARAVAGV